VSADTQEAIAAVAAGNEQVESGRSLVTRNTPTRPVAAAAAIGTAPLDDSSRKRVQEHGAGPPAVQNQLVRRADLATDGEPIVGAHRTAFRHGTDNLRASLGARMPWPAAGAASR